MKELKQKEVPKISHKTPSIKQFCVLKTRRQTMSKLRHWDSETAFSTKVSTQTPGNKM